MTKIVSKEELSSRVITFSDWVPCKAAFIDCKTPGSDQKDNYSFVGPGVSQSSDQFVNVSSAHGFQLGAAGMPNGVSNSLHLHFTAEVFVNFEGEFQLRWGPNGEQGNYISQDGDVITVPTWIFRGFTNIGPDDGILYTALGRDDTGGIIWGPQVLQDAEGYGLHLTRENLLVDTEAGDPIPSSENLIRPLSQAQLESLEVFSEDDFRKRVITREDRVYFDKAFLCSSLPGGRAKLALVIGYGLTENRRQVPPIHEPHSFSAAWIVANSGEGILRHKIEVPQTITIKSGTWKITINDGDDKQVVTLSSRDAISIPEGSWRQFRCISDTEGELFVVSAGDNRVKIDWHEEVINAAHEAGFALDPNDYVAPVSVLEAAGLR
ncbi:cupin domain-containing protein [Corynebacterium crudilactis]|uniref:Cupin 2 conserved barrel domain-containing protein n=1 Tax=Corynebacterium crudilactis TaxID=1652495 RepID=A0A172QVD0_9CORY|nr:cupin domain-containing protein [Corynebacterium crudilactis]ANE04654.1 hypothetical protein ccrud_10850 [Corynebacterium crudilactis]